MRASAWHRIWRPVLLFVLTIMSTTLAGFGQSKGTLGGAVAFSATLMSILAAHEMGHYLMARKHHVEASLPHFIPLPPPFMLGTLGAVITMRTDQARRNQLMDIGAAGPIAGFVVAVPLMILGLSLSTELVKVDEVQGQVMYFGDSILSKLLGVLIGPEVAPGTDFVAHPVFVGAWAGFLVTAINLLPMGQLDGGHVLYAFSPEKAERWARRVYRGLIFLGLLGLVVHGPTILHGIIGERIPVSVFEAVRPLFPWMSYVFLIWALMGKLTGLKHPPVTDVHEPLTPARRATAIACLAIAILTFMPSPIWLDGVWKTPPAPAKASEAG